MSLNSILLEAIAKTKIISIHAAAKMCDMPLICNTEHEEYDCCMRKAADQIKERILSLLDSKNDLS